MAARQQNNICTRGRRGTGEGGGTVCKVNGSNIDSQGGEGDRGAEKHNNNKSYTAALTQLKWWGGGEGEGGGALLK